MIGMLLNIVHSQVKKKLTKAFKTKRSNRLHNHSTLTTMLSCMWESTGRKTGWEARGIGERRRMASRGVKGRRSEF